MSLAGKVALVCNSSSSLGYAIARKLGSAGAQIYLSDPDETGLNFALDGLKGVEIKASGCVVDLSYTEQRNKLFEKVFYNFKIYIIFLNIFFLLKDK